MIVIIDYGMGNSGSILNMLKKFNAEATISSKIQDIEKANKFILPGVGAFDDAMKNLNGLNLLSILHDKVIVKKTPILGICLGMQIFTKHSEEGHLPGLGWIDGETVKFRFHNESSKLKIPHMGWNTVKIIKDDILFRDSGEEYRFYFVHSYHVICKFKSDIVTTTHHGYNFVSSIHRGNIFGTQFHPEKSHKFGMQLLKNFVGSA
jgi:glutamine amidotransferase